MKAAPSLGTDIASTDTSLDAWDGHGVLEVVFLVVLMRQDSLWLMMKECGKHKCVLIHSEAISSVLEESSRRTRTSCLLPQYHVAYIESLSSFSQVLGSRFA